MTPNKAVIISAPSGSGKTTIVRFLLDKIPDLQFSISATSRKPRKNEVNGVDYYFFSRDEFLEKISKDEFIEWEEVYKGDYYGTLKSEIEDIWARDKSVIFDVDVKGGINLKKYFSGNAISIYLMVNDMAELEKRLRGRKTESEKNIRLRLARVRDEMQFRDKFDHVVINEDLDLTCRQIFNLVNTFLNS